MLNPLKIIKTEPKLIELEKEIKAMNQANWKTNTVSVVMSLIGIALIWAPKDYTQKLMDTQRELGVIAAICGVGYALSKDHDK